MQKTYIIRFSEIMLKGKNRNYFEKKLKDNIVLSLKSNNVFDYKIKKLPGRIFILTNKNCDFLRYVFGIHSISFSYKTDISLDSIKKVVDKLLINLKFNTFRVTTKKADKKIKESSYFYSSKIGEHVFLNYNKKVDLKDYDLNITIEIFDNSAYIFTNSISSIMGLPISTNGNILVIKDTIKYKNNFDELAAFFLMKRGCKIYFAVNNEQEKNNFLFLKKFEQGKKFHYVNIKEIDNDFLTKYKITALSLGLTSKDYIDFINNLNFSNKLLNNLIILSPLHSFNEKQIKEKTEELIKF